MKEKERMIERRELYLSAQVQIADHCSGGGIPWLNWNSFDFHAFLPVSWSLDWMHVGIYKLGQDCWQRKVSCTVLHAECLCDQVYIGVCHACVFLVENTLYPCGPTDVLMRSLIPISNVAFETLHIYISL